MIKELKAALLRRGMAKSARACSASCLDLCEFGASIVVEPDHVVYGHVTPADVEEIADAVARGRIVERLVVARAGRSSGTISREGGTSNTASVDLSSSLSSSASSSEPDKGG